MNKIIDSVSPDFVFYFGLIVFFVIIYKTICYFTYTIKRQIDFFCVSLLVFALITSSAEVVVLAVLSHWVLNFLHNIEYKINRLLDERGIHVSIHEINKEEDPTSMRL